MDGKHWAKNGDIKALSLTENVSQMILKEALAESDPEVKKKLVGQYLKAESRSAREAMVGLLRAEAGLTTSISAA